MTTAVGVFFTTSPGFHGRIIRRVTGGDWSHCGVVFDIDGKIEYFESLFRPGVVGPRGFYDLVSWAGSAPGRRMTVIWCEGLPEDQVRRKRIIAQALVGIAGYAQIQLVWLWAYERILRHFKMTPPRSPRRMICSEFTWHLLDPEVDCSTPRNPTKDVATPQSIYLALQRFKRARGTP